MIFKGFLKVIEGLLKVIKMIFEVIKNILNEIKIFFERDKNLLKAVKMSLNITINLLTEFEMFLKVTKNLLKEFKMFSITAKTVGCGKSCPAKTAGQAKTAALVAAGFPACQSKRLPAACLAGELAAGCGACRAASQLSTLNPQQKNTCAAILPVLHSPVTVRTQPNAATQCILSRRQMQVRSLSRQRMLKVES